MPRPRQYESLAAKQAAYRARRAASESAQARPGAPGYAKWRKAIAQAYGLLEATYEELDGWMADRSERWQEGEAAGELEADRDQLCAIMEDLAGLNRLAPKH